MFQNVVAAISKYSAYVAIAVMSAMVVHIMVEIILRSFFATSTHVAEEFVGYGLATVVYLALGHSLNQGGLIRVDLVFSRLPTRVRRLTEITIILVTSTAMLFVTYFVGRSVLKHYERGTVSWTIAEVPFWIPEGIVLLGICLFLLQLIAYLLRILAGGDIVDDKDPSQ